MCVEAQAELIRSKPRITLVAFWVVGDWVDVDFVADQNLNHISL